MIVIDGAAGEGGGQVLRSALTLSTVTGKPFRIEKIRENRKKPGLLRQHLTSVKAAAEVCGADVEGAEVGSRSLAFRPGRVKGGDFHYSIGTAGSTTLVLQTVLPVLATASGPSRIVLEGGTHNIYAPPFDFLERAYLPLLARMGPKVEAKLEKYGFYPAGGGRFTVEIEPVERLAPIDLIERGEIKGRRIRALVSQLSLNIGNREVKTAKEMLRWEERCTRVDEVDSPGPGNVVSIEIESDHVTEVFTGFGEKRVPAEKVAAGAAAEALRYLEAGVPVGEHLADQLLLLLALAGDGSFRTLKLTRHSTTNIEVVRLFLDVDVQTDALADDTREVRVSRR